MENVKIISNSNLNEKGIRVVENSMTKFGIVNPYTRIAILSTIAKESGFVPKSEYSYANTSNSRLRKLFGTRLSKISDNILSNLKKNDKAFFEVIYGGRNGNDKVGDGYKYRGRGFNQLTFKSSYKKYGKMIGKNLVSNPYLLNDTDVASDVAVVFLKNRLNHVPNESRFPIKDINGFKDQDTATYTVVSANHGWGRDVRKSNPETLNKAISFSSLFEYPKSVYNKFNKYGTEKIIKSFTNSPVKFVKRNWLPITAMSLVFGVSAFFVIRKIWKK